MHTFRPRSHRLFKHAALAAALIPLIAVPATAQDKHNHPTPPPVAHAVALKGAIKIDGRPDEAAWQDAPVINQFTQSNPDDGKAPTQRTEVRILYDNDALYIAAWLYDSLGRGGITGRLVRRDHAGDGEDLFQVILDTFHDHQGRTRFEMNPAGVRNDATGSGTQNPDPSWDPIYEAASSIDDKGWYVEMRIPFSQLRYPRNPEQTWGLELRRFRAKNNEEDDFAYWHKTDAGGPPMFGHLEGLRISAVPEKAELIPYVVSRASYIKPASPTDPFNPGHKYDQRVGADLKYLLTSNLPLDATINPDFGQVEVDPASVNLSAFETFFDEKRPFFVANSGFFNFGGFSCFFCSNTSSLPSFYTRRIGRAPQGSSPPRRRAPRRAAATRARGLRSCPRRLLGRLGRKLDGGADRGQVELAEPVLRAPRDDLLGQLALRVEQGVDPLLERPRCDELMHLHVAGLTDPESAVRGLLLNRRIPPAVVVEDVVGARQIEADAARFQREDEDRRRAAVVLEAGHQPVAHVAGCSAMKIEHVAAEPLAQVDL